MNDKNYISKFYSNVYKRIDSLDESELGLFIDSIDSDFLSFDHDRSLSYNFNNPIQPKQTTLYERLLSPYHNMDSYHFKSPSDFNAQLFSYTKSYLDTSRLDSALSNFFDTSYAYEVIRESTPHFAYEIREEIKRLTQEFRDTYNENYVLEIQKLCAELRNALVNCKKFAKGKLKIVRKQKRFTHTFDRRSSLRKILRFLLKSLDDEDSLVFSF